MPEPCPPHLGLVCITHTEDVRFKTITRTRLLQLPPALRALRLRDLYAENILRLHGAIRYCQTHGIRLYRLSSGLFPGCDEPPGGEVLATFAAELATIGQAATTAGIRLVMHPDQFVVLSSDDPAIVTMGIGILERLAWQLDLLGQPRSPWAAMELHGGKGDRARQLATVIASLPPAIRKRLVLENDERAYSAAEILAVCEATDTPMVFDAHHHIVHDQLDSYDHPSVADYLAAARQTWPDPAWQLVHISNGRSAFGDRAHSDLITAMPAAFQAAPWIEVEAKHKEVAIAGLRREWLTR